MENCNKCTKFVSGEKNEELKDDALGEVEFKKLIQKEIDAIINVRYDNIILLAGAGASVVVQKEDKAIDKNYGKTVNMIADDVYNQLNKDKNVYSIKELSEISLFKEYKEENSKIDYNLEDFLSNLLNFKPYVKEHDLKKYTRSINKILKIVKNNTKYDYKSKKLKHGTLLNILSKKIKAPNKLSIVTTNYDTLFEEAGADLNYIVFDGFNFSEKPKFESDIFDWNLVRNISIMKTNEVEYHSKVFNLIKIHGSLTWMRDGKGNIYRKDKNKINNIEDTVMIFPSSNKYAQSYQAPYFELFTKFQELLKKNNTLLITTGFSFSDNHIFKMITQAIKNNATLTTLISDYNIDQESENWQELIKLMEAHKPVYFLKATLNDELTEYLGGIYHEN